MFPEYILVLKTCAEIALFSCETTFVAQDFCSPKLHKRRPNVELHGHFVGKCTYPCFFACNLCDYSLFNPFFITWMANYFYTHLQNVIKNYSIERHWLSLNEETGAQLCRVIISTSCWLIFLTSPAF